MLTQHSSWTSPRIRSRQWAQSLALQRGLLAPPQFRLVVSSSLAHGQDAALTDSDHLAGISLPQARVTAGSDKLGIVSQFLLSQVNANLLVHGIGSTLLCCRLLDCSPADCWNDWADRRLHPNRRKRVSLPDPKGQKADSGQRWFLDD